MDSPGVSEEWPSDLAEQVEELNRETVQSNQEQFDSASFSNLPAGTITEAPIQMFTQAGYNFSFFPPPPATAVQTDQVVDIHSITESLQQQLQGLSKDFTGWSHHAASKDATPSTVILNIDGTAHEIPISFHLDSSAPNIEQTEQVSPRGDVVTVPKEYAIIETDNQHVKLETPVNDYFHIPSSEANIKDIKVPSVEDASITVEFKSQTQTVEAISTVQDHVNGPSEPVLINQEQAQSVSNIEISEDFNKVSPKIPVVDAKVRKSSRLANQLDQVTDIRRPQFKTQSEYDTNQLWCEDCQQSYEEECPIHVLQPMYDKVVLSRAWSSLPNVLQIFRLVEISDLGVFTKKYISKRVQFGPFISELVEEKSAFEKAKFPLAIQLEEGTRYIEASNENECNWMMFVRPAENYKEQNLVAYQYQDKIYFSTIKDIHPKEELKVWYAAHYANKLGLKVHEKDTEQEEENKGKFECSECDKKLRTAALLQKHITDVHDHDNVKKDKPDDGDVLYEKGKKSKLLNSSFQSWKKKKNSLYFNKIKKYRDMKTKAEAKRKEMTEEGWKCEKCPLRFDNSVLLNIHTLTHAAEAAQKMEEMQCNENDALAQLSAAAAQIHTEAEQQRTLAESGIQNTDEMKCPCCSITFEKASDLINHAAVHAKSSRRRRTKKNRIFNPSKPHQCDFCIKTFCSEERLVQHRLVHSVDDSLKPLTCNTCKKKFMNNAALACHLKTHSTEKYYQCPICREGFDQMHALKKHGVSHAVNGVYPCTHCHKTFYEFNPLRKHIRAYHPYKELPCPHCDKVFPRTDKLKLHMLKHTNIKEYMCDICGRQFKRKDKLKEHTKRMHDPNNPKVVRVYNPTAVQKTKFIPKVQPTDYERFIYKCHHCMLGFKRRGMLVNHLAKRHPGVKPDTIPELNLPILRTQRDFFCQYCDKVYKSSSKRKTHIMKCHPGADLPPSGRIKGSEYEGIINNYGINTTTFTQLTGSIAATPHQCPYCHKQYASKPKLLQHQRKDHPLRAQPKKAHTRHLSIQNDKSVLEIDSDKGLEMPIDATFIVQQEGQTADILTQAMSELTHSFTAADYCNSPQTQLQQVAAELQLNVTNVPAGQKAVNSGVLLQPTLLQAGTAANVELTPFVQEMSAQEANNTGGGGAATNMQQITIVHGNQSQTISVPMSLATQLISRSYFVKSSEQPPIEFVKKIDASEVLEI